MRRLVRNTISRFRGDDGATLVFVAVILVALLALTAFAVDFGRMYEERRQLQNGADAAALAIAEDCARGLCAGAYDEYATGEIYVDDNARDGSANAWKIDLDLTEQTVTVHNRTEDPGGDNKFDMLFAGIVGFDGFTVGAQATVAWGNALQIATVPIIISECEWLRDADDPSGWGGAGGGDDVSLIDPPDYGTPYHTMIFHIGSGTAEGEPDSCIAPAGGDVEDGEDPTYLHGGFGYLAANDECAPQVYGVVNDPDDPDNLDYGWVKSATGNDHPDCDDDQIASLVLALDDNIGKTIFVPYFDQIWDHSDPPPEYPDSPCDNPEPGNDNKCYHISGYGAFHVVGYKFGGTGGGSDWTNLLFPPVDPPLRPNGQPWPESQWENKFTCLPDGNNSVSCLLGYFTNTVYSGPADIGGDDRGITVIKFTG